MTQSLDYIQFSQEEWNQIMSITEFNSMPIQDYVQNPSYRNLQEAGKNLKKKQRRNKSKSAKINKRKIKKTYKIKI